MLDLTGFGEIEGHVKINYLIGYIKFFKYQKLSSEPMGVLIREWYLYGRRAGRIYCKWQALDCPYPPRKIQP